MRIYENNFVYGREMVKKLLILAVITSVASVLLRADPTLRIGLSVIAVCLVAGSFFMLFKNCRCPHCGKLIFLGVLAVTACPKCRRNLITGKKVKKSKR